MIRIATRLGIMACRYLVRGYDENRYISAPEIAEYYNMNVRALMPSLRQLTQAGILRSRVGGTSPGFIFAKDPKGITMLHILIAMEGETHFACCRDLVPDLKCDCKEIGGCGVFTMFHSILGDASNIFSAVTIVQDSRI